MKERGLILSSCRIVFLLGLLATAALERAQGQTDQEPVPPADGVSKLTALVFDAPFRVEGITRALVFRDRGYAFEDQESINAYNIQSAWVIGGTAQQLRLKVTPLESPFWWSVQSPEGAAEFIRYLAAALHDELRRPKRLVLPADYTVLRKALAGRNLYQIYSLLHVAGANVASDLDKQTAAAIQQLVARLFASVLLTQHEYDLLQSTRPRRLPSEFTSEASYSLADNYLPRVAVTEDDSWFALTGDAAVTKHFLDYGGRTFVKIYVRSRELDSAGLMTLWKHMFDKYGRDLHTSAASERVPEGLETVLVRTFGVFLDDGTYRDSFWPEEVIVRQFKHRSAQVDLATSDFRGTVFFQYKLSQAELLRNPASLGLHRVHDDEEQFYGFYGDVPDPRNSYGATVTTMRSNCLACHSELFYGLSTVFTFGRDPRAMRQANPLPNDLLKRVGPGRYVLQAPEFDRLQLHVKGSRSAEPGRRTALPEAAQTWTEGVEYERIEPPMPIQVPAGKIEVIEFFAYWCPHCKDLQAPLEEWRSRAPADVVLRRVPIIWRQDQALEYARLYYTLERLGRFDLHFRFFEAIDEQRNDHGNILQKTADHVAFAVANGIPEKQFIDIYDSEAVSASVAAAQAAVADYKVLYAPTIVVQGTYRADRRALSGGGQELLRLVDEVVAKVRRLAAARMKLTEDYRGSPP